ncbi:uracil-DNA glycosylase [Natroniella sulfidigena]|uniref:uracil-DNA glycosylase n=1 Tax=Natroniella sulfidigena TaxID=723921 RepID=UPI00200AC44F|nr:uracil-DNA glycosylase [Natroniella sulfidigena]MCK8817803.1 uracil-DNA glycosylase [Natroniella sulfidigena]
MLFNSKQQLLSQSEHKFESLQEIKDIALNCQRCRLRAGCKQVVFGVGNRQADLMFVGEGPGADEDRQGIPFVGRAGQLLNRILTEAGIDRDEVYISNIVKCRPPENRKPTETEMKTCLWILAQEIKFVDPKILVPLGSTATRGLLNPKAKITRMRGQWVKRRSYYLLPTFHPAALLWDENKKLPVWKDFLKIKKAYEKYLKLKAEGKEV